MIRKAPLGTTIIVHFVTKKGAYYFFAAKISNGTFSERLRKALKSQI